MNAWLLSALLLASTTANAICQPTKLGQISKHGKPVAPVVALRANQQRWKQQKLKNYRFTLKVMCYCQLGMAGAVRIEVRNGVARSIKPLEKSPYFDSKLFASHNTIDKIFGLIEEAIQRKEQVEASYNPKLGYPIKAYLNPNYPDGDDRIVVSNFTPLR